MTALLRKYATATHIYVPLIKRGVVDFAVSADWTPAAGDVKISLNGGAAANVTNLPVAITMGNTAMWDFSLTAGEVTAAKISITVADAATKAVEDQFITINTWGHASAEFQYDLSVASPWASARSSFATAGTFGEGVIVYNFTAGQQAVIADLVGDAVLDGDVTAHTLAATFGKILNDLNAVKPATIAAAASDVPTANQNADALLDRAVASHTTAGTVGAVMQPTVYGNAQTGSTSTTIKLAAGASATDDIYNGRYVLVDHGTSSEHARITAYNGTTKVATVDRTWTTTPVVGDAYEIAP